MAINKISDIKSVKKINHLGKTTLDHYQAIDNNDVAFEVPLDSNNKHYMLILEWVDAGNTIQEAD